jgi:hypothetical protein
MKRSSQVLLVLMGVTTTTAVGHYVAPPRPTECVQQAQQARPDNPQQALPQCKNTSSNRLGSRTWWWRSSSSNTSASSSSEHTRVASSQASASQTSAPGAARGGFGSTGHGISSSS